MHRKKEGVAKHQVEDSGAEAADFELSLDQQRLLEHSRHETEQASQFRSR